MPSGIPIGIQLNADGDLDLTSISIITTADGYILQEADGVGRSHVSNKTDGIQFLVNGGQAVGALTGIGFSSVVGTAKTGIGHIRTTSFGRGDLVLLANNTEDSSDVTADDVVVRLDTDRNLFLEDFVLVPVDVTHAIPDFVYAVAGQECNLYFANCVRSRAEDIIEFNLSTNPSSGAQDERGWVFAPEDSDIPSGDTTTIALGLAFTAGETTLTSAASTTVALAKSTAGTGESRNIIVFGDSTDNWMAEFMNLFDGDAMTATLRGTRNTTENDSDSGSRSADHESVSGWTYNEHLTDPASEPVISGSGTWDFGQYLIDNSFTMMTADDWVLFFLGINDVFGAASDSEVATVLDSIEADIESMIDTSASPAATTVRGDVSGVRVGIGITIPPSTSQDSFGSSYGTSQSHDRYRRNNQLLQERLIATYDNDTMRSRGVYVVPIHLGLDINNNMKAAATAFNARNTDTYIKQTNGVHPENTGYWQIADSVYAFIKYHE
jgi:lysophospholipase L1-like esterase